MLGLAAVVAAPAYLTQPIQDRQRHQRRPGGRIHLRSPSIQQPKHPKRHLLPVADLNVVGGDVSVFHPGDLSSVFAGPTYLYGDATVEAEIALIGVLEGVEGQSLT